MACCGLCGSVPRQPSLISFPHTNDGEYPNRDWMGKLYSAERETDTKSCFWQSAEPTPTPKITLKNMIIPGSHDSASYSIPKRTIGSAIGRTQRLTIREQLLSGVRFLDLRIANGKRGIHIFHGPLQGCTFWTVLNEITGFCNEFPTEFVIVYVTAENGQPFSAENKAMALWMMTNRFGSNKPKPNPNPPSKLPQLLCKVNSRHELFNTPLQELVQENGQICVLLKSWFCPSFMVEGVTYNEATVKKEYGFFASTRWLQDRWHNTSDARELVDDNFREICEHKANEREYFVNNQFVLTPAFKTRDIPSYLTRKSRLQPVYLANKRLYQPPTYTKGRGIPLLHETFVNKPEEDWNILSLDYVDLAPAAIQLWIGMNFAPLEIELALLGNSGAHGRIANDVTDLVRSKVLRKSCLFLHPKYDFDLRDLEIPEASLTLIYKISGTLYTIVVALSSVLWFIDVVVLNQHNHLLAGGTELTIEEGEAGNVTICPSGDGVAVPWQRTEEHGIRFGYLDEGRTVQQGSRSGHLDEGEC